MSINRFRVVVARSNPQHSYHLAVALQKVGMLEALFTGLYTDWHVVPFSYFKWLPGNLKRIIEKRIFDKVQRRHVKLDPACVKPVNPWSNGFMAVLHRIGFDKPWYLPFFKDQLMNFQLGSARYSKKHANALVLYDTEAYYGLIESSNSHLIRILDMATIPWQKREAIYQSELELWPEYARRQSDSVIDNEQVKRAKEELILADYILVGSRFVKDSLVECGIPAEKIYAAYYGCDIDQFRPTQNRSSNTRFTILYVGSVGLAKGFHTLLQVLEKIDDVPLYVVCCGLNNADLQVKTVSEKHVFHFLGLVPHSGMAEIMRQVDMLCHPSLYDSFSLTCLEAMASGLPVLTTTSTGVAELITHGRDGFVVPPSDINTMVEIVKRLVEDPDWRGKIGKEARNTAEKYTWETYEERIAEIFSEIARYGHRLAEESC